MIKKTITITSLAILVAAISVATTMTMVQANVTDDFVDINIPTAILTDLNVQVGGGVEYTSAFTVVDAQLSFADGTNGGTADGVVDVSKLELTIDVVGTNVPDGTFTFAGTGTSATVDFVDANSDKSVQLGELTVSNTGTATVADGAETITADASPITVDITGGAGIQTVEIDLTGGSPSVSPIVVTISDIEWVGETGAIGSFACSSSVGANSSPKFSQDTLQVTVTPNAIGTTIDIICQFEGFHGDVEKVLDGSCGPIGLKGFSPTPCSFIITYRGVTADVIDTVPAEWKVTGVSGNEVDALLSFADGTNSGTADGLVDVSKLELTIDEPGTNVPDGTFTFVGTGTSATVDFVDANSDKSVQLGELTVSNTGTATVADGQESITADAFDTCTFEQSNKKNNNKSSTPITCDDATDVNLTVDVETRESPGKGHNKKHGQDVFKPTFCTDSEHLFINDGAQAILVDESGVPVLGTLDSLPIVLDSTDPIEIIADDSGPFDCDGELK